ncbi:hypothetical protein M3Y99_01653500 [Aphelenchoides fujianensis]|nr:hypothetical protein M3Y99_01653500 [Aphelenchoides fujianensis]
MVVLSFLLPIGLLAAVAHGQFGQGVNQGYGQGVNQGYAGLGQPQGGFEQPERASEFPGGVAQAVPSGHQPTGFGQQVNNGVYGQPNQNAYGQAVPGLGQEILNSGYQNGGYGVGQGRREGHLGQPLPLPNANRGYRNVRSLGQNVNVQQPGGLGQSIGQPQGGGGLGQSLHAPNGLGQNVNSPSLGQHVGHQPHGGLGQNVHGHHLSKRYANREPYRKSCNSFYGKLICYRLYEKDANIPHDFTCWTLYMGQKNCTETENVLYLDRRNVEIDRAEVDRRFFDGDDRDSRRQSAGAFGRQSRTRDDEFGAVENGMHSRRNDERDERRQDDRRQDDRNVRVYDDRELRGGQRS